MRTITIRTTILAAALSLFAPLAFAQVPQFTIDLTPVTFPGIPGLQSFARGQSTAGQWLLLAGRTNGLHTFSQSSNGQAPANAFPPSLANNKLWVVDPVAQRVWSAPVPGAGTQLGDSLTATNLEWYQDGDTLYLIGGYGASSAQNGAMMTFPTVTMIPVTATCQAITQGVALPAFPQVSVWYDCVGMSQASYNSCFGTASAACNPQTTECLLAAQNSCLATQNTNLATCDATVLAGNARTLTPSRTGPYYATATGGGLQKIGSVFWLTLGQNFTGLYSVNPGDYGNWPVNQVYTQAMTALWFGTVNGQAAGAVLNVLQHDPNTTQWNRRDLNVIPMLDTDGTPMVGFYGGVFVPGQVAAYQQPLYLRPTAGSATVPVSGTVSIDPYKQLFNQYETATLKMYSSSTKNMMTVIFGGIGLYYLNTNTNTVQQDTNLPFVSTLSVMSRARTGVTTEAYRVAPLPALLGTDGTFIPVSRTAVPHAFDEILSFDSLSGRTLVGWLYGGILASAPQSQNGPTSASAAIYAVYVTPGAPPANYWGTATPNDVSVLKSR